MDSNLALRLRDDGTVDYDYYRRRACQERNAYVREAVGKGISAVTPSARSARMFGVACVLAVGAFFLTMLKDPPQSVAGHPGAVTVKSTDVQVPTGLPAVDCLTTSGVCP